MTTIGSKYRGTKEFLQVYCELIQTARYRGVVYYKRIAHLIGIDDPGHHMAREVGQVRGEISEDEHHAGRPMLSAVAVGSEDYPGEGFFALGRDLGLLDSEDESEKQRFWEQQRDRAYDTWCVD